MRVRLAPPYQGEECIASQGVEPWIGCSNREVSNLACLMQATDRIPILSALEAARSSGTQVRFPWVFDVRRVNATPYVFGY